MSTIMFRPTENWKMFKKLKKKNEAFKALVALVAKATLKTCLITM